MIKTKGNPAPREEARLWYSIGDVGRLFGRSVDGRVKKLGITRAQWQVLGQLLRQDGVTQIELANHMDMEAAPVGRVLDKLETQGWVVRRPDPLDRRARRVFKTQKLESMRPKLRKVIEEQTKLALAGCSKKDLRTFLDVLAQVRANLAADLLGQT